MPLSVLGLNCSLKRKPHRSNTQVMMDDIVDCMRDHEQDLHYETVRISDLVIAPGVELESDDPADEWPHVAMKVLSCDVLLLGVPIWLGHPSSLAQRVLERLDHYLFAMNERGMKPMYGKVAAVAVTGNEDGGHHVCAEMFQALNDLGFTLPPESRAYWTGWSDEAPNASYPTHGRDNDMARYMIEHCARNLVWFGRAIRDLEPDIPQLASDRSDAARSPEEAAAKAARAHA